MNDNFQREKFYSLDLDRAETEEFEYLEEFENFDAMSCEEREGIKLTKFSYKIKFIIAPDFLAINFL